MDRVVEYRLVHAIASIVTVLLHRSGELIALSMSIAILNLRMCHV